MDSLWTTNSLDMFGALFGVLALIFAAAWLVRRLQHSHGPGKKHLRIVSVLPLSTKERVVLIQAGEEQVLMGVSAAGIQHLHTLNQPVQSEATSDEKPHSRQTSFAESLRLLTSRVRS